MLTLNAVSKSFAGPDGPVCALDGVTLTVEPGEFVVVCGPSGSGKSTLLLVAGALLTPGDGAVHFRGTDVYALGSEERNALRAEQVGFVFQQFHLLPYLTVLENALIPSLAIRRADAEERARSLIAHFGLEHRINHVPAQLSTGEKQRAALARALLNGPALLLADEPTGNLDDESGATVLKYLAEFAQQGGAVLMVTHDHAAAAMAHRTVHMRDGRLV
jgi:ABC-type lipoprotein export system ATPase subunit